MLFNLRVKHHLSIRGNGFDGMCKKIREGGCGILLTGIIVVGCEKILARLVTHVILLFGRMRTVIRLGAGLLRLASLVLSLMNSGFHSVFGTIIW